MDLGGFPPSFHLLLCVSGPMLDGSTWSDHGMALPSNRGISGVAGKNNMSMMEMFF